MFSGFDQVIHFNLIFMAKALNGIQAVQYSIYGPLTTGVSRA